MAHKAAGQRVRDAAQAVVTGLWPVTRVEAAELVQVHQQDAERFALPAGTAPFLVQACIENTPVVHAGQPIRIHPLAQLVGLALECQLGADAGPHHLWLDRFGDEVHRAGGQRAGFNVGVVMGRDEHHWNVAGGGVDLEPATDLEAVHAGHAHIQQHQIRLAAGAQRQGLFAVGGHQHLVVGREGLVDRLDVQRLVVDHQQARAHFRQVERGWRPAFVGAGVGTAHGA